MEEKINKKMVQFYLDRDIYKKLKVYCIENDKTVREVLADIVAKFLGSK